MEDLVVGGDLKSYLERKYQCRHYFALNDDEACFFTIQLLQAIEHIHANNIAHRDIKPENVLLQPMSESFRLLLCDFGAACSVEPSLPSTMDNEKWGTHEYLAPSVAAYSSRKRENAE